jgi:predicted transposase YbfD/YdcC
MNEDLPRARLTLLLEHFSTVADDREPCRVAYPLAEVMLLVTCATICSCDDFDDIVDWGVHHLDFLRGFSDFHHGVPGARWLRILINRIDPNLFAACFESWVAALWSGGHEFIAIDGKTARRTHDHRKGLKALHTLSAYASTARLVLGQLSVPEKANEITAIPDLLDQLARAGQLKGALVSIDAIGCQVKIAANIIADRADYILPVKGNQPTLAADIESYFHTAPPEELVRATTVEKGHGRIETRRYTASKVVDWIGSDRTYPGQPRFPQIKTIVRFDTRTELADRCTYDTHFYIASIDLDIDRIANSIRAHWGVEAMHWILDVEFKDDLSRYRTGHGPKNMSVVRRFALNLVKASPGKGSIKTKRKRASWSPQFLLQILQCQPR